MLNKSARKWKLETLEVQVEGEPHVGARFVSTTLPLRQEVQFQGRRRADPARYAFIDGAFMRDMARDLLRELVREAQRARISRAG